MSDKPKKAKRESDDEPQKIEARVLVGCGYGLPNDVVALDASQIEVGVKANQLDPHPDAVAYAKSIA